MFRIGEFSKIAQVPGSLLRYYDEIGLLKPARVDQFTGYRYYSTGQLPRLHRILALKELGLTLEQIGRLLNDEISADEIRGMLTLKKAQVEQAVQEELLRLRQIESRLQQIESGDRPSFDVVLKTVPAQPYLSRREILPALEAGFGLMQEMMQTLPARIGQAALGHFTAVIHSESLEEDRVDVEMGFTLTAPTHQSVSLSGDRKMMERQLPAVEAMATVMRVGGFENNYRSYGAIGLWIESNGYVIAGPGREVLIQPPRGNNIAEMVTEIQFPVEAGPPLEVNSNR